MRLLQQETGQRKCLIDLHELRKEQMESCISQEGQFLN